MTDVSARAAHAKRLMDDPMLMEALANIRLAATNAWQSTGTADTQAREFAWLTVKVVSRIEAEFESIVTDGKIAAARIQAPVR